MSLIRRWFLPDNGWSDCPHCHQSMTGMYRGVLRCFRCTREPARM